MSFMREQTIPFSAGSQLSILGIFDGRAGHRSQVAGLCEQLASSPQIVDCRFAFPWNRMPSWWIPSSPAAINNIENISRKPPQLLVSCGRQAAMASLFLRRKWKQPVFSVHLLNPQMSVSQFDLIAAPEHDGLRGDQVISTLGALHPLSPEALKQAAAKELPEGLVQLGPSLVAVLLGGPNRYYRFSREDVIGLTGRLLRIAAEGYSLAIIPSQRTPQHVVDSLTETFGSNHFVWDRESPNPYRIALARASHVIVSSDSISMISEATATGRPVYVEFLSAVRAPKKFGRFHQSFLERGLIRPFVGRLDDWSYEPLYETSRVAQIVRERMLQNSVARRAA